MGNCSGRGSSTLTWDGEDWGSMGRHSKEEENERLLGERPSSVVGKEVKVMITRKQLEELINRMDGSGGRGGKKHNNITVDEVMDRLMESSEWFEVHRHGAWRPALESIPELD